MDANPTVRTVSQVCLISSAGHIIQEDGSISRAKDVVLLRDGYCICKVHKIEQHNHLY